jgi:hypothetical protein
MRAAAAAEFFLALRALAEVAAAVMENLAVPEITAQLIEAAGLEVVALGLLAELVVLVSSLFLIQCRRLHPLHLPLRLKSQFQQASQQLII